MGVFEDSGMYTGFALKPAAGFAEKVIRIPMAVSFRFRFRYRPISLSESSRAARTSMDRAKAMSITCAYKEELTFL